MRRLSVQYRQFNIELASQVDYSQPPIIAFPELVAADGSTVNVTTGAWMGDVEVSVEYFDSQPALSLPPHAEAQEVSAILSGDFITLTATSDSVAVPVPESAAAWSSVRLRCTATNRVFGEGGPELATERYRVEIWPAEPTHPVTHFIAVENRDE